MKKYSVMIFTLTDNLMNKLRDLIPPNTLFDKIIDPLSIIEKYYDSFTLFIIGKCNKKYDGYKLMSYNECEHKSFHEALMKCYLLNNGIYVHEITNDEYLWNQFMCLTISGYIIRISINKEKNIATLYTREIDWSKKSRQSIDQMNGAIVRSETLWGYSCLRFIHDDHKNGLFVKSDFIFK